MDISAAPRKLPCHSETFGVGDLAGNLKANVLLLKGCLQEAEKLQEGCLAPQLD